MRSSNRALFTVIYLLVIVTVAVAMLLFGSKEEHGFTENGDSSEVSVSLHMIDVGQGDAIFIDNGDKDILVDAGPRGTAEKVVEYLDELDAELEYVFFSHPHEDHIGGGDEVLNYFDVSNVVMPKYVEDTQCYRQLMQAVEDSGCQLSYGASGDHFVSGEITIDILSPGRTYITDDPNHISLIMKVSYGDIDMIFTGDAEESNENFVVGKYSDILDSEILKVGHHGSSSSSTQDFLDVITPEVALISLGEGNPYGHPHMEALIRLNSFTDEVHRTDTEGDLVLGITKNKYWFVSE